MRINFFTQVVCMSSKTPLGEPYTCTCTERLIVGLALASGSFLPIHTHNCFRHMWSRTFSLSRPTPRSDYTSGCTDRLRGYKYVQRYEHLDEGQASGAMEGHIWLACGQIVHPQAMFFRNCVEAGTQKFAQ